MTCTLLVASTLTACASSKSERSEAFLAPIEDQTLDIVGDVYFGLQLADSVQLNHYMNSDTPKIDAYSALWDDLLLATRAIVIYSADLVDLVDAAEGDAALEPFIKLIATLDSEFRANSSARAHLGGLNANSIFAEMRSEDEIIDAVRTAQPLMTDYADIVTEVLAATDQALADAVFELYEMINSNHSPMLTYREKLTARQNRILDQLQIMDKVWSGDRGAWSELLASDWVLSAEIGKDSRPSAANAKRAEQHLIDRLEIVSTIRRQLEPAFLTYKNELQELYQVEESIEATLRLA